MPADLRDRSRQWVLDRVVYDPEDGCFRSVATDRALGSGSGGSGGAYLAISLEGRSCYARRLAFFYMTGQWPKHHVDHINLDKRDNRWCNLREATMANNKANEMLRSTNTSGWKGVSWHKAARKWRAYIGATGEHLGLFDCPAAAHLAYFTEAARRYGEFARSA